MNISLGILGAAFATIVLSRLMFRRWFNHVSLYAFVWGFTLALFHLRFIEYYPLDHVTWLVIVTGWISFVAGSFTVLIVFPSPSASSEMSDVADPVLGHLRRWIWILSLAGLAGALLNWMQLIQTFGSIGNALLLGNVLYSMRVAGEIGEAVPYLSSVLLAAIALAGVYTGLRGKFTILSSVPMVCIIVSSLAAMGRSSLLIGFILFVSGFFFASSPAHDSRARLRRQVRNLAAIALIGVLGVLGAEAVRGQRGTIESFEGATQNLNRLGGASFITPSIYLYFSVHHGVLNQYLKGDGEKIPVGGYTFAPLLRALSKLGFDTYVTQYTPMYVTPVPSNTGTYLKEVHADFGMVGVLLYPYALGSITSLIWLGIRRKRSFLSVLILTHLYVAIGMSFLVSAPFLGYWVVSISTSALIGYLLDRNSSREHGIVTPA